MDYNAILLEIMNNLIAAERDSEYDALEKQFHRLYFRELPCRHGAMNILESVPHAEIARRFLAGEDVVGPEMQNKKEADAARKEERRRQEAIRMKAERQLVKQMLTAYPLAGKYAPSTEISEVIEKTCAKKLRTNTPLHLAIPEIQKEISEVEVHIADLRDLDDLAEEMRQDKLHYSSEEAIYRILVSDRFISGGGTDGGVSSGNNPEDWYNTPGTHAPRPFYPPDKEEKYASYSIFYHDFLQSVKADLEHLLFLLTEAFLVEE